MMRDARATYRGRATTGEERQCATEECHMSHDENENTVAQGTLAEREWLNSAAHNHY